MNTDLTISTKSSELPLEAGASPSGLKAGDQKAVSVAEKIISSGEDVTLTLASPESPEPLTGKDISVLKSDEIDETLGEFEIRPDEIVEGIYIGNKDNAYNALHLKKLGVTHILNAAFHAECPHKDKFKYLHLELLDTDEEDLSPHFEKALAFIDQGLKEGKVLVHCMSGMSRSASFVIAWLINKNGWSFDHTLDFVKERRSIVEPNEGFCRQLKEYAKAYT